MTAPFPNLPRLRLEMVRRGIASREDLARKSGISNATASRVLAGRPVTVRVIEQVSRAVLAEEPSTAVARLLALEATA